jgi:16S rRNA (guanine527-N7)-methyltransferase
MQDTESNHSLKGDSSAVLSKAAAEIGIHLEGLQLDLFRLYEKELLFWNRKVNLISIKSAHDVPIKHFTDSLTLGEFIPPDARLLDIGTGAGFPGVPLKILKKSISLTLVESNSKKVSFLKELCRKLNLDVKILNTRVEDLGNEYRSAFDIVVSRAGLRLPELLKKGAFFAAPGGKIIAMKGGDSKEEETLPEGLLKRLGMALSGTLTLRLPVTGDGRKIIIFSKS